MSRHSACFAISADALDVPFVLSKHECRRDRVGLQCVVRDTATWTNVVICRRSSANRRDKPFFSNKDCADFVASPHYYLRSSSSSSSCALICRIDQNGRSEVAPSRFVPDQTLCFSRDFAVSLLQMRYGDTET